MFNTKGKILIGSLFIGIIAAVAAVYIGISDSGSGQISVNEKILDVDPSTLGAQVNTNTQAAQPNGGLVGQGKPAAPPPPPPEDENASSTDEDGEEGVEEGEEVSEENSEGAEEQSEESTEEVTE